MSIDPATGDRLLNLLARIRLSMDAVAEGDVASRVGWREWALRDAIDPDSGHENRPESLFVNSAPGG